MNPKNKKYKNLLNEALNDEDLKSKYYESTFNIISGNFTFYLSINNFFIKHEERLLMADKVFQRWRAAIDAENQLRYQAITNEYLKNNGFKNISELIEVENSIFKFIEKIFFIIKETYAR